MPKISAATVGEHHERRRQTLLLAAREELREVGPWKVTLAKVGQRSGLARSSVYEYFGSTSELLCEIAIIDFQHWASDVTAELKGRPKGWPTLETHIDTTLALVADNRHHIAESLSGYPFTAKQSSRFRELHLELAAPVTQSLEHIGVADPQVSTHFVQALLNSATKMLSSANPNKPNSSELAQSMIALLRHGLT